MATLAALLLVLSWTGLSAGRRAREGTSWTQAAGASPSLGPRRSTALRPASGLAGHGSSPLPWVAAGLLFAGCVMVSTWICSASIAPPLLKGEDVGPVHRARSGLQGEFLAPPQPLPPACFIGIEDGDLERADRDWSKLDGDFRATVLQLFDRMEARGYRLALLEGFRSPARQERLALGGPGVTRARGGQSRHQRGLAVDVAPLREQRLVISEQDPWVAAAYRALGEEATQLGLAWGGAWAARDLGHIEQAAAATRLASASPLGKRHDLVP